MLTPGTPADNANPAILGDVTAELIRAGGLGGGIGSVLYNDDTASSDPDSAEFFVYNAVGHTVALSDYSSAVTQLTVYEAFGQEVAQSGTSTNNRLRNTKERDQSIGLDNDGFRYYDPATGRYIQRDPIGYGDGMNVYAHVLNDPINTVDPLGLQGDPRKGNRAAPRGSYHEVAVTAGAMVYDVLDFGVNVAAGWAESNGAGGIPASGSAPGSYGRAVGYVLGGIQGGAEMVQGGGLTLGGGLAAAPFGGTSLVVSGAGALEFAHGMAVAGNAIDHLAQRQIQSGSATGPYLGTQSGKSKIGHAGLGPKRNNKGASTKSSSSAAEDGTTSASGTSAEGTDVGQGGEIVRPFDSKKNVKAAKKNGIVFDPDDTGISATTTDIDPVGPDTIREMTGARNADHHMDINIDGKKVLRTNTKEGHADIKIRENVRPEDIVNSGRTEKSTYNRDK